MITKHSCTADASSDVVGRLNKAIDDARNAPNSAGSNQVDEAQKKIDELRRDGLLKRQEYAAATHTDFRKLFIRNDLHQS